MEINQGYSKSYGIWASSLSPVVALDPHSNPLSSPFSQLSSHYQTNPHPDSSHPVTLIRDRDRSRTKVVQSLDREQHPLSRGLGGQTTAMLARMNMIEETKPRHILTRIRRYRRRRLLRSVQPGRRLHIRDGLSQITAG